MNANSACRQQRRPRSASLGAMLASVWLAAAQPAAGLVIEPPYDAVYAVTDLGAPPGVPFNLGGLTFKFDDPNTLLIGGEANDSTGAIYAIGVIRDGNGHITGFSGSATFVSDAANIDGGLAYGPDNVLFYTAYDDNELGQIELGSSSPDRIVNLDALGVGSSVGTFNCLPPNSPGAGRCKVASYDTSEWYDVVLTPDGNGTFDVSASFRVDLDGVGPEGFVYVPNGSPGFPQPTLLITAFDEDAVIAYSMTSSGDPIVGTARPFMTDLGGALGATTDPVTGDLLFSSYDDDGSVVLVRGFVAPGQPLPPRAVAAPAMSSTVLAALATVLLLLGTRSDPVGRKGWTTYR
mgnify:CR=1 FL=1